MSDLLTFLILSFACYRITRLAILDTIFDAPRDWLHAWLLNGNDHEHPFVRYIAAVAGSCMVMLSMIFGLGAVIGTWPWMTDIDRSAAAWWCLGWAIAALVVVALGQLLGADGPTWIGHKIEEMISCPYCLSVWVGLGLMLGTWTVRPIPLPAFYFLALSAGGMVVYQYIDFEPDE